MAWWLPFAQRNGRVVAPPDPKERDNAQKPIGSLQKWQVEAWRYHQELGEIHYASGFYARMISGMRLYVEERTTIASADTSVDAVGQEWKESTNADLVESLARLENSTGGMAALQGQYGRLIFVQGEAMLCRTLYEEEGVAEIQEQWEMLSAAELSYNKDTKEYKRRAREGMSAVKTIPETDPEDPQPGTMMAWRFYHRDPQYSGMADSSIRAVLKDCEELVLLKRSIRNMARNRGAGNGILMLPSGMGGAEVEMADGTKIPKNAKTIYDALIAPIANEEHASAVTPVIMFAPPGTTPSEAFHIDIRGAALYKETGLRDECIKRIAIGLDMPPEALVGTSGVNHWTAWQIDETAWTNHGDPIAREFVGFLTRALLHPIAIDHGVDPASVRIWYDATEVVQDPDRARAAAEAFDRIAISEASYRRETGFQEDDAPDDAEWQRRADVQSAPKGTVERQKAEPPTGQANLDRIIGMADACVLRCRELAGSKLRTKLQSNGSPTNLRVRIRGAHNCEVAAMLGGDMQGVDPDVLVAGAGQVFLTGMRRLGLDGGLAETLVRRVEEHAARTLFNDDPGDLPDEVLAICGLASLRVQ